MEAVTTDSRTSRGVCVITGLRSYRHAWFIGGWLSSLPFVAGSMVLFGAIMMNARPQESRNWGIIVVIFSVLGLAGWAYRYWAG